MSKPLPVLETDRLILRPPQAEDFEPWAAFVADAEVQRFIGGAQERAVAWRMLRLMAGAWAMDGFGMFSVLEKASGCWIGRLGPWCPADWPGTEVGWALVRDAWGKGYAIESATAAIDWAFDNLGWTEVVHTIAPENVNSQAVAKRLGSTILRDGWLPAPINSATVVWGQSREQWMGRRRSA
ncbi:GNAT family N-acetyltransferase [Ferrovibrio xuzhouensis]|uniref:GNAT family N-acetyltransferase n=1 Tax=Ferrovibrio xuzhouensis TaxID=1576914 RepID=A0ABV7VKH1_9PROT